MLETLYQSSIDLTLWLQSLGGWLTPVMQLFTFFGNEEFYLFVMPLFIWVIDYRLGFRLGVMLLLTSGINNLAKMLFRMPRPYWVEPSLGGITEPAGGYGLPSGHAQNSLSIFGLLAAQVRRRWVTAVVVFTVLMIGLSRIYFGEHFALDVAAGWILAGLVLAVFLALEPRVTGWFHDRSFAAKSGALLGVSLVMILLAALVIAIPADYQVPAEWVANAAQAYPETPIEPLKLSDMITSAATLFGVGVGYFWITGKGGFRADQGPWWQRLARFVIGLAGVALLWIGLGEVFPDGEHLLSWTLRFIRYGLVGLWIAGISPWLFIRFRLGERMTAG
jgi:membrane-associated phospholipid phosphatase